MGAMTPFDTVLAAIDAANAADPNREPDGRPAALVYGERMSQELARRFPGASEHLRIAARGQHVERWKIARGDYPEGRAGYLAWRTDEARAHGERVAGMMAEAGYAEADRARVASLLRKEGLKRDAEAQALEDVICFVFLRWYFDDFAAKHGDLDIERIVAQDGAQDVAGSPRRGGCRVRAAAGARAGVRGVGREPRQRFTAICAIWNAYGIDMESISQVKQSGLNC